MLLLLTRLAVKSARREPSERAAFPCSTTITDGWFRSALYTGSATFALGQKKGPEPDCLPFWWSLEQSLVASQMWRCLRAFI